MERSKVQFCSLTKRLNAHLELKVTKTGTHSELLTMLLDFNLRGISEIEYDDSKSLMLTAKRVLESYSTSPLVLLHVSLLTI